MSMEKKAIPEAATTYAKGAEEGNKIPFFPWNNAAERSACLLGPHTSSESEECKVVSFQSRSILHSHLFAKFIPLMQKSNTC